MQLLIIVQFLRYDAKAIPKSVPLNTTEDMVPVYTLQKAVIYWRVGNFWPESCASKPQIFLLLLTIELILVPLGPNCKYDITHAVYYYILTSRKFPELVYRLLVVAAGWQA